MAKTFKIVNGDVVTSSATGRQIMISGKPKLGQDIAEFFTVDIQPNGFGAGLEQLIGVVQSSQSMFVALTDTQIRNGLKTFINLIAADNRISRTNGERIVDMSNLVVSQDNTDPTKFYFSVNIITADGSNSTITQSVVVGS